MADPIKTLSSDQPIDDIVSSLMQNIARKGRGFTLGVAAGEDGKAAIEVKESLPPHDEWQAPAGDRAHQIDDTDSFLAYARKYGTPDGSLVFFNEEEAVLAIAEMPDRGQREIVKMPFNESDDWTAWTGVLSQTLDHKTMLKFLMAHEHNLQDPTVLKAMQSMKLNSTINVESEISDDGKSVGVMVKTNAGEELKKFPKAFGIHLPVLEQDDGDPDTFAKATIRLEVVLPDDPKRGPTFGLWCSTWKQTKLGRIRAEGNRIREGLDGWTVPQGTHATKPKVIGR